MPEQYVVVIDGRTACPDVMGRGRALGLAMAAVELLDIVDVTVTDARTLRAVAQWRSDGVCWQVRAIEGWLDGADSDACE
jgi:hypothetical protein